MTRVAIYARYSSDQQNARSIADQVVVCQRHAEAKGWNVQRLFSDAAISGAAMANRPGLLDAVAAAERQEFDVLLCEDEDRIARSIEHLAHVANRLRFAGVHIATLSCDEVLDMHVAFKGLMAADFLRNLSQKTKRGMHSNAEKGLATGSRTYGYLGHEGGGMEIVPAEADVVLRIARAYAEGDGGRQIAADLNRACIPSPRGGLWNASTINGSRQRANGILNCEVYAGVKVWNRWDMRKDANGKRIARIRPKAEWKFTAVPHLRIVDEATWAIVRARKAASGEDRPEHHVRNRASLFAGLLKCGHCGASFTIITTGKIGCAGRREKGPDACDNIRTPMLSQIEERILTALRDRLLSPQAVETAMRSYHERAAELRSSLANRRAPLERRLGELTRSIDRLVDAIERGSATAQMEARISVLDQERITVEQELSHMVGEVAPIRLHPNAPAAYAALVAQLQTALAIAGAGETRAQRELVDAVRALVDRIELHPQSQQRRSPIDLIIYGRLAAVIDAAVPEPDTLRMGQVVAGASLSRTQPSIAVSIRIKA